MRKPFFKVAKALVVILLFTLPLTVAAKQQEWSDLIYYCTYWSVVGRCPESSWVSKLTNFPQSSEQALPQVKTNVVTIDFYAIDLDDFPVEQEILRQELKKRLEIIYRQQFGRPVKVESLDFMFPGDPPPPPRELFDILFNDSIPPSENQVSRFDEAAQAIIAQAKNNKEKYLVASVHTNPINPVKLCYSFERVYKSGKAFHIDVDKALRNKVREILKSCSWS